MTLLTEKPVIVYSSETRVIRIRCWSKTCGRKPSDRRMLFQATEGATGTIFIVCPRCGSWQPVRLDDLT